MCIQYTSTMNIPRRARVRRDSPSSVGTRAPFQMGERRIWIPAIPNGGEHVAAPIPRILMQTWHAESPSQLSRRMLRILPRFAAGFQYRYFSDTKCIEFLTKHYGNDYKNKFLEMKLGAHKADFFRYCYLYIHGGVYMDVDMEPQAPMTCIMESIPPGTLISSLEASREGIFQSFIATPPKHPIFKVLIGEFFSNRVVNGWPPYYTYFTRHMGMVLRKWKGSALRPGLQTLRDGSYLFLFEEKEFRESRARGNRNMYVTKGPLVIFKSHSDDYAGQALDGTTTSYFKN